MRIWSLHPEYLDPKGLVALWREALLAQKVLAGETKGYKNHPQLIRFRATENPRQAISSYLWAVAREADRRGYTFDKSKIIMPKKALLLPVPEGQVDYEFKHLLAKLKIREPASFDRLKTVKTVRLHPIFEKTSGGIEYWEKI